MKSVPEDTQLECRFRTQLEHYSTIQTAYDDVSVESSYKGLQCADVDANEILGSNQHSSNRDQYSIMTSPPLPTAPGQIGENTKRCSQCVLEIRKTFEIWLRV